VSRCESSVEYLSTRRRCRNEAIRDGLCSLHAELKETRAEMASRPELRIEQRLSGILKLIEALRADVAEMRISHQSQMEEARIAGEGAELKAYSDGVAAAKGKR
jgi:tRNA A37 N6-isopentenylltransferase MiaA